MELDIQGAIGDGLRRTVGRAGIAFVGLYLVLWVFFAYLWAQFGRDVVHPLQIPVPTYGLAEYRLPSTVAGGLWVVALVSAAGVTVAAFRTFATDKTGTIPDGAFTRNTVPAVIRLLSGGIVFVAGVIVLLIFPGIYLLSGFMFWFFGSAITDANFAVLAVSFVLLLGSGVVLLVVFYLWAPAVAAGEKSVFSAYEASRHLSAGSRLRLLGLGFVTFGITILITVGVQSPVHIDGVARLVVGQLGQAIGTVFLLAVTARAYSQLAKDAPRSQGWRGETKEEDGLLTASDGEDRDSDTVLTRRHITLVTLMAVSGGLALFLYLPYLFLVSSVPHREPVGTETESVLPESADRSHPSPRVTPTDRELLKTWSKQSTGEWQEEAKVKSPRVLLARLELGQNIEATNEYIKDVDPWSVPGSTWPLVEGDYDFTMVTLVTLLYRFGEEPDRLYPETRNHLLNTLLPVSGGDPDTRVPGTFGRVFDTENHILMTESTRFLKNQWLHQHVTENPAYDNRVNGLEEWLMGYLNHIRENGFYEFNSVPYQGYALHPLLNLEAFANGPIAELSRAILDDVSWRFALGSCGYRQIAPFRRQLSKAGTQRLEFSRMSPLARLWAAPASGPTQEIPYADHHAVVAAPLAYRPPQSTQRWIRRSQKAYFARIGHGPNASPELHSGGPGYLLSAGGVFRGRAHQVAPRPTTLLLRDGAKRLNDCFHIPGGGHWTKWNNTGVHDRFAVGNAPVSSPGRYEPVKDSGNWAVYNPEDPEGLRVATWNRPDRGLLALFPDGKQSSGELLTALRSANTRDQLRAGYFRWPSGGQVSFDLDSPAGRWVITSVDGEAVDRRYDQWPLLQVDSSRPF